MNAPTPKPTLRNTQGPLRGVRVVEFAGLGPAPFAAMLLSDMGADVVRIDRAGALVEARDPTLRGRHLVHLDLKSTEGQAEALGLIDQADVLIEGFRPGVMERLGLGPEAVLARHPGLVYGRMTGWGQSGPLMHAAGHDINYISLPGALAAIGTGDMPLPPLNLVGDYGGGALYLVTGVLAALLASRASGAGQVVDAAMCDGVASLMTPILGLAATGLWEGGRASNLLDGGAHFYRTYVCADGRHVAVGAIEPQFYALLRERAGLDDPAFDAQRDPAQWPELSDKLAAIMATRSRDEWTALFEGSDACVTPVLTIEEAPKHPHLAARGSFVEHGGQLQSAPAPRFSRTPSQIQAAPAVEPIAVERVLDAWRSGSSVL
ncbi:CaiB/BaiF CoA-transferase family protein [Variovorax sp. J31P207]|uniref:CaiB/BaiF CoA transferase family protein n=1 Tax=Variovorax sp. J31P207 TaxID=3053510 RepID=UPI00257509EC|nr:CaiB/BaiF CoA-transferase family protein [Variovorax sp. J31P207]MDM0072657.1 CaiB/BaiF CoA-transferase family protein [Variovorax sp. J31P207]